MTPRKDEDNISALITKNGYITCYFFGFSWSFHRGLFLPCLTLFFWIWNLFKDSVKFQEMRGKRQHVFCHRGEDKARSNAIDSYFLTSPLISKTSCELIQRPFGSYIWHTKGEKAL